MWKDGDLGATQQKFFLLVTLTSIPRYPPAFLSKKLHRIVTRQLKYSWWFNLSLLNTRVSRFSISATYRQKCGLHYIADGLKIVQATWCPGAWLKRDLQGKQRWKDKGWKDQESPKASVRSGTFPLYSLALYRCFWILHQPLFLTWPKADLNSLRQFLIRGNFHTFKPKLLSLCRYY